jgi:hypothetical protein
LATRRDRNRNTEKLPVFTVGHSNRTLSEFVELLRAGDVRHVVDIRRFPRSRANPATTRTFCPANSRNTGSPTRASKRLAGGARYRRPLRRR